MSWISKNVYSETITGRKHRGLMMMNELGFQERLIIPPGGTERHQGAGVAYRDVNWICKNVYSHTTMRNRKRTRVNDDE